MDAIKKFPRVGVGVLIFKDNQILLGKRKNAHGDGTWSPAGGHLEYGETFQECARREVLEETGLVLGNVTMGPVTNDLFISEEKHYITIFMIGEYSGGQPQLLEPEKCTEWRWFDCNALPSPLFLSVKNMLAHGICMHELSNTLKY